MPNLRNLREDKLKIAAKVLFELPPSDTLPVFKRLSIDDVRILLDQIKHESQEGRGLTTGDSSLLKPHAGKTILPGRNTQDQVQLNDSKKQKSFCDDICDSHPPNKPAEQTSHSLTDMKRLVTLTDDQVKAILKHCDTSLWAPALKNAPISIQQKIKSCMAPTAAELLKIEIDKVGDVNEQEEKLARERIIHTAIRLASHGHSTPQPRIHESDAA